MWSNTPEETLHGKVLFFFAVSELSERWHLLHVTNVFPKNMSLRALYEE